MKKIAIVAFIVVLVDQISKFYIKTHFHIGEGVSVFPDWFQIVFVENPGMAYGLNIGGSIGKVMLAVMRWFLIGFGIYYVLKNYKKYNNIYFQLSFALILAGALGNVIDSTFYGLIFDSGTTWDVASNDWNRYYPGISKADFSGYAPLFQGCVVDMLHFPLFSYTWPDWLPIVGGESGTFFSPVFNIADSAITVGGAIWLIFREKVFSENKSIY